MKPEVRCSLSLTLEKEGRLSRSGVMGELEAQCPELRFLERGRYRWVPAGVGRLGVPPWTAAEPTNPLVASYPPGNMGDFLLGRRGSQTGRTQAGGRGMWAGVWGFSHPAEGPRLLCGQAGV